jgi:hypothetical protein
MAEQRGKVYPRAQPPGLTLAYRFGCPGWLAIVALAAASNSVVLGALSVLLPVALVGGSSLITSNSWRLTDDGLERRRPRRRHTIPWSAVRGVTISAEAAVVATDEGPLRLGPEISGWVALATAIEQRLDPSASTEAAPAELVPPEQVAAWLGLGDEPALVCRLAIRPRGLAPLLAVVLLNLGLLAFKHWQEPILWFGVAFALAGIVCCFRLTWEVRATPEGIEWRHPLLGRRFAWAGLWRLEQRQDTWVVQTRDGELYLPPDLTNLDRLLSAIRSAIAAREAGLALPRLGGEVPDTALSRAKATVDAERGLSRGDG